MPLAFEAILKKLKEQKEDLLSHIERWRPEMLTYRLTAQDWSVLEVLDHIVKTEVAILEAAGGGLANPHRIGVADRIRTTFLQKIFASDRKVKVPASAREVFPGSALELEDIRKRWSESREQLNRFVSQDNPELFSKGIFRHPVGGWMGMEQILDFFSVHLIHHDYQFKRIFRTAASDRV